MAVDLDQIQMRQAIDQASRSDVADAPKIIGVNIVDVATGELFGAGGDAVEHLIGAIEVMDRAENEIEPVPVFLDPGAAGGGSFRIVIQLYPSANFHVGIRRAQFVELIEIDPAVVTIVIGEGDIGQSAFPRAIDPRLEQCLRVGLDAMALRVAVVIREWSDVRNHYSTTP